MLHLRLFCAPVNKMCLKIPKKPMRGDLLGLRTLTFFFPYKFMIIAKFVLCHFWLIKSFTGTFYFWIARVHDEG